MARLGSADAAPIPTTPTAAGCSDDELVDLADVRGLPFAREALEVAAAGGHHLLFCGPPGTGKTMLARRLEHDPAAAGARRGARGHPHPLRRRRARSPVASSARRPFRAPHHTASTAALVGGGSGRARPGEITLAHRGVLFLDELGEFAPTALDALRQPLRSARCASRARPVSLTFPAAFQLVACSNPCPCGSAGTGAAAARRSASGTGAG